jgi:hypothetical protein
VPCSKSALDVGYMPKVSDRAEFEEMFILCPLWNLAGSCGVQQGLMVDPAKIVVIINLEAPRKC